MTITITRTNSPITTTRTESPQTTIYHNDHDDPRIYGGPETFILTTHLDPTRFTITTFGWGDNTEGEDMGDMTPDEIIDYRNHDMEWRIGRYLGDYFFDHYGELIGLPGTRDTTDYGYDYYQINPYYMDFDYSPETDTLRINLRFSD
jgi:hypothetical protein